MTRVTFLLFAFFISVALAMPVDEVDKPDIKVAEKPVKPEVEDAEKPVKPEVEDAEKPVKPEVEETENPIKPEVKEPEKPEAIEVDKPVKPEVVEPSEKKVASSKGAVILPLGRTTDLATLYPKTSQEYHKILTECAGFINAEGTGCIPWPDARIGANDAVPAVSAGVEK